MRREADMCTRLDRFPYLFYASSYVGCAMSQCAPAIRDQAGRELGIDCQTCKLPCQAALLRSTVFFFELELFRAYSLCEAQ